MDEREKFDVLFKDTQNAVSGLRERLANALHGIERLRTRLVQVRAERDAAQRVGMDSVNRIIEQKRELKIAWAERDKAQSDVDALQGAFDAELAGNAAIREKHGARLGEGFAEFIERIAAPHHRNEAEQFARKLADEDLRKRMNDNEKAAAEAPENPSFPKFIDRVEVLKARVSAFDTALAALRTRVRDHDEEHGRDFLGKRLARVEYALAEHHH